MTFRPIVMIVVLVISLTERSPAQLPVRQVALFCKVWGFLKYHHPLIAGGTIDWDSAFIAHIHRVVAGEDDVRFNLEIAQLINAVAPVRDSRPARLPENVLTRNHDLRWLGDRMLDGRNRHRLQFIYAHRHRGNSRWVKYNNCTDYSGENAYKDMAWPVPEYRLLFLARFWNAIHYYDPYKFLASEEWNRVLETTIPEVWNATDTAAYYRTLLKLAVALHDGHAQLVSPAEIWGQYTLPMYITIVDDTAIITHVDTLSREANLQEGDIITSIHGQPVATRLARMKPYTTSSNRASLFRHLEYTLLCTPDTIQDVTITRRGKTIAARVWNIPASRRDWRYVNNYTANETGYKTIGSSIAYIYTMQVWDKNVDSIKRLIQKSRAVIFDARNYTQNDAFYRLFDMFLPCATPINYSTRILPCDPGFFQWVLSPKLGGINPEPYAGVVIILADERCQSQGEYSVMALQTIPHAVTFGSQTTGTDGPVSYIPMGGSLGITYSGYGIYYPDRTPTQQRGVRIDIPVKKTVSDIIAHRDRTLEAALAYLKARGIE